MLGFVRATRICGGIGARIRLMGASDTAEFPQTQDSLQNARECCVLLLDSRAN
jgi:hypothetical protein